jgi:hypothetical protein
VRLAGSPVRYPAAASTQHVGGLATKQAWPWIPLETSAAQAVQLLHNWLQLNPPHLLQTWHALIAEQCCANQHQEPGFSINGFDQNVCCWCAVLPQAVKMAQRVFGTSAAVSASALSRPPTGPLSVGCCCWIHPHAWQGTMQAAAAAAVSRRPSGCSRWLNWPSMQVRAGCHASNVYTSHVVGLVA